MLDFKPETTDFRLLHSPLDLNIENLICSRILLQYRVMWPATCVGSAWNRDAVSKIKSEHCLLDYSQHNCSKEKVRPVINIVLARVQQFCVFALKKYKMSTSDMKSKLVILFVQKSSCQDVRDATTAPRNCRLWRQPKTPFLANSLGAQAYQQHTHCTYCAWSTHTISLSKKIISFNKLFILHLLKYKLQNKRFEV